ncbi:MAG: two-component system, OmpR family, heavy metal sensor histidine kinase CusS [Verrucomicrobiota bacterium]|jgi:two-component system heavy metal sensor histidine kinase CusS
MFSKPAEPRSIASQLVLLFTLASAFLFCCGLGILYWIVVRHAFEEDSEVLADRISALHADLIRPGGVAALSEQLKSIRAGERLTYWVRVIDANGQTLAETPGMNGLLPSSAFPNADASIDRPKDYRASGKLFSLVATQEPNGGETSTMQVAQDRSADENFMKEFGALLAAVLALGVLASAVIAFTVTRSGLRPLVKMTRSLRRVGPKRLHERVPLTGWPREVQPLAVAFDEMLDRLEDSFTRLSQFSADLAHELRTPIANIRGEGEVALTRVRTPEEYRQVIESSVAECERLSAIVDNLLFLARAEAAEGHIQRALFAGKEAVEKIRAFHELIAEERRVAITVSGDAEIDADPMLFGRAVSNLVQNALRFTPPGGTISISLSANAAESKISVTDSGCGIASEHLPRVFDRFYRADSSRSAQGSGLGLALVKSIMDLHGGSAVVESEVDRGTVVTLRFPNRPTIST